MILLLWSVGSQQRRRRLFMRKAEIAAQLAPVQGMCVCVEWWKGRRARQRDTLQFRFSMYSKGPK